MKNSLAHGLVNLARGGCYCSGCCGLVSRYHGLTSCANCSLKLGANRLVACLSLAVGANSLDVGLDVCHVLLSLAKSIFLVVDQNKLKLYQFGL